MAKTVKELQAEIDANDKIIAQKKKITELSEDELKILQETIAANKELALTMPIAHKQGNYIAEPDTLNMLMDEDRIAFRYQKGEEGNPNGSMQRIAGIINEKRNVLGMMPHPERAAEDILGSKDGLEIFKSLIGSS